MFSEKDIIKLMNKGQLKVDRTATATTEDVVREVTKALNGIAEGNYELITEKELEDNF